MSNIWLSVTLQNEPFCIVVHFQPVIKLLQKDVRVHHRRVMLMQETLNFFLGRDTPCPRPPPRRLNLNPSHSEILLTLLCLAVVT